MVKVGLGLMRLPFPRTILLLTAVLWAVGTAGAAVTYELEGRIEPPRARVRVTLDGATTPYAANTFSDAKGRFRFRKLAPGPYTLYVYPPGADEIRRTVEVGPGVAGKNRRVSVVVKFDPTASSTEALERAHTVSVRELGIPESAKSDFRKAESLLGRNRVAEAIQRLEQAVKRAPGFVEAWNFLGTIAYRERRYGDAERYFRSAVEQDPGIYAPALNLAGVLITLGRYDEALEYNVRAVERQPDDALANAQLGINYFRLGRFDEAARYLREAKRLDPDHFSHPQRYLATIYLRKGDRVAAIAELEDLLKRHPDDTNAKAIGEVVKDLRRR